MILHVAEVWLSLAVCFILGALIGSILQRTIALTGLGAPQARLIRFIDRVIRWLERRILPWRGTGPVLLPQTVPVPPPDFGHAVEELVEEEVGEAPLPRFAFAPPVMPDEDLPEAVPVPAKAPVVVSEKQAEALSRGDAAGFRPLPLPAPRNGQADPLHVIQGITKRHAGRLGQVGIFHFSQIASWTPQEVAWIAAYLGAGDGPVEKDWVGQAIHFAGADVPIEVLLMEASKKRAPKKPPAGDQPLKRKTPGKAAVKPKRRKADAKVAEPAATASGVEEEGGE